MKMRGRWYGLPVSLLMILAALPAAAFGQARGGMPRDIPVPRDIPGPRDIPSRGPPDWVGDASSRSANGLDRADQGREQRLSKPEVDRAAAIAKAAPADYELDRNGALVIRGEVLASSLDAGRLARIEKDGFSIIRRSEIAALGVSLAVIAKPGMSARAALDRLRRIDPQGSYDLNHVLFESGETAANQLRREAGSPRAGAGVATVGLIDTSVATTALDNAARIRIVRRNFAQGASVSQHGTAVAELLAKKPGRVAIYAADIFGAGPRGGTSELLIQALGWMAGQRVPVINISMVGPSNTLVATVIAAMIAKGFIVVAPVGNDGAAARPLYPASYPGVIAVSGANSDGQLLPEASRVRRVDFVGPGIATIAGPAGRPVIVRGTSFAAPVISREIADSISRPDPAAARRAIAQLAARAIRPRSGGKWFGRGLIGVGAGQAAAK